MIPRILLALSLVLLVFTPTAAADPVVTTVPVPVLSPSGGNMTMDPCSVEVYERDPYVEVDCPILP